MACRSIFWSGALSWPAGDDVPLLQDVAADHIASSSALSVAPDIAGWDAFTFALVTIGWVFFRLDLSTRRGCFA